MAIPILNISAYRFVRLNDTAQLKDSIHTQALQHALRGTVLLATEGINLFLAGTAQGVYAFLVWLRGDDRFSALQAKESWSVDMPFAKLIVKEKREIIRMNRPAIAPDQQRAAAVDAATLALWLDAGRDDHGRSVVMLDTRNRFELGYGKFRGAVDWGLDRFSQFPDAALQYQANLTGKTVVSYCTGGIRCEKAALVMQELGVQNVLQLEGGILQYLALTDGRHFEGSCFVFDGREALDTKLKPYAL
jgi:UPF0176 protein